jgi:hypothetical protein
MRWTESNGHEAVGLGEEDHAIELRDHPFQPQPMEHITGFGVDHVDRAPSFRVVFLHKMDTPINR